MKNQMTQAEFDAKWPEKKQLLSWWAQQSNSYKLLKAIYARERAHAIAEREKEKPHPTMELPDGKLSCSCGAQVPFKGTNLGVQCQDCSLQWRREWFYEPWSPDKSRVCEEKPEAAGEFWTRGVAEDLIHNGYLFRPRMRGPGTVTLKGSFVGRTNSKAEAQALVEAHIAEQARKDRCDFTSEEMAESQKEYDEAEPVPIDPETIKQIAANVAAGKEPEAPAQGERPYDTHRMLQDILERQTVLADRADAQDARLETLEYESDFNVGSDAAATEHLVALEERVGDLGSDIAFFNRHTHHRIEALEALEAQAKPEPVSEPCALVDWDAMAGQIADLVLSKKSQDLGIDIAEIVKAHLSNGGGDDE